MTTLSRRVFGIADMAVDALRSPRTQQAAEPQGRRSLPGTRPRVLPRGRATIRRATRHRYCFTKVLKATDLGHVKVPAQSAARVRLHVECSRPAQRGDHHPRRALRHVDHRDRLPPPAQVRDPRRCRALNGIFASNTAKSVSACDSRVDFPRLPTDSARSSACGAAGSAPVPHLGTRCTALIRGGAGGVVGVGKEESSLRCVSHMSLWVMF